jgi:transcriptional regulator with XRE-family HTH domain
MAEAPTTTAVGTSLTRVSGVALHAGLLPTTAFGTNSGIAEVLRWANPYELITTTPPVRRTVALFGIADEVRELRDAICSHGLTRQDVARAVGVDRRSLSAWASGEMRPGPERLRVLHTLARLVDTIASERPGRVRDVLVARRGGTAVIDRVATEGVHVLETWRAATWPEATVTLRSTAARSQEPIWAAAARASAEGRLKPPTWERTVRPAATYEMDLEEARAFGEPEPEVRRRGYR